MQVQSVQLKVSNLVPLVAVFQSMIYDHVSAHAHEHLKWRVCICACKKHFVHTGACEVCVHLRETRNYI